MDVIHRWFGGGYKDFRIYSQQEADDLGIKYVYWLEAKKGDWALSDDGYVGECLKVYGPYKQGKYLRRMMTFSFAAVWDNEGTVKLKYLERKATRAYSRMATGHWAESEVKSARAKRFILAYVMMFMAGKIDWRKLGIIYRPNEEKKDPVRRAKFMFKQEAFQRMIKQKMVEVFKDKDITEGDVVDMFSATYALAKKKKDIKEMRKVAEDFRDLLDMLPHRPVLGGQLFPTEDADWEEIDQQIREGKTLSGRKKQLKEEAAV